MQNKKTLSATQLRSCRVKSATGYFEKRKFVLGTLRVNCAVFNYKREHCMWVFLFLVPSPLSGTNSNRASKGTRVLFLPV